jgi:hypothetical protein
MQRYATYRTQVYTVLAAATGLEATRLPAPALASLPDYFRAGLTPHDAADRLLTASPATPFPPRPPAEDAYCRSPIPGRTRRHERHPRSLTI